MQVDHMTYWDNNDAANYTIIIQPQLAMLAEAQNTGEGVSEARTAEEATGVKSEGKDASPCWMECTPRSRM